MRPHPERFARRAGERTELIVRSGPWLLAFPIVLVGALIWSRQSDELSPASEAPEKLDAGELVEIWTGELVGPSGQSVQVRLLPLHGEKLWEKFDREVLGGRYDLGEGAPWRIELEAEEGEDWESVRGITVTDPSGVALLAFGEARQDGVATAPGKLGIGLRNEGDRLGADPRDPLESLLARGSAMNSGRFAAILWGRTPIEGANLELQVELPGKIAPQLASTALLRGELPCRDFPRHIWQLTPSELDTMKILSDG